MIFDLNCSHFERTSIDNWSTERNVDHCRQKPQDNLKSWLHIQIEHAKTLLISESTPSKTKLIKSYLLNLLPTFQASTEMICASFSPWNWSKCNILWGLWIIRVWGLADSLSLPLNCHWVIMKELLTIYMHFRKASYTHV